VPDPSQPVAYRKAVVGGPSDQSHLPRMNSSNIWTQAVQPGPNLSPRFVVALEQKRHASRVSIILTTLLRIFAACALDFPNRLIKRANHSVAPYVLNGAASSTILEIPSWRHEFGRSS
jgi:hypothetical protein